MSFTIYQPAKSAMQSGVANCKKWILEESTNEETKFVEPLMGWIGDNSTKSQVKLQFSTLDDAETFAKSKNIEYKIILPKKRKIKQKSYADNFK